MEDGGGLEAYQQLLLGPEPQLKNEEFVRNISIRLKTALEKMLMAISNTTDQVGMTLVSGLFSAIDCLD